MGEDEWLYILPSSSQARKKLPLHTHTHTSSTQALSQSWPTPCQNIRNKTWQQLFLFTHMYTPEYTKASSYYPLKFFTDTLSKRRWTYPVWLWDVSTISLVQLLLAHKKRGKHTNTTGSILPSKFLINNSTTDLPVLVQRACPLPIGQERLPSRTGRKDLPTAQNRALNTPLVVW